MVTLRVSCYKSQVLSFRSGVTSLQLQVATHLVALFSIGGAAQLQGS